MDLIDILSGGEPPAFANDADHRIIFWNRGAEEITGRSAAQALGRLCHEVFAARDAFGNRFCTATCAVTASLAVGEPLRRFEVVAGQPQRSQHLGFTILKYPDARSGRPLTVHLMDQVLRWPEIQRALEGAPNRTPAPRPDLPKSAAGLNEELSEREREVLRSIAAGQPNKQIADALGISVATARNHIQHILRKLGVHSKLEAIALAFKEDWV
jgi:DNA-binding CsgD family transcriptional regulator